ncbi:MAG: urea ABC transporter permease subunit UrtC [Chloroflexi bacterium]|nr:urea ABC transporter permease subunit UrtC [Chloroflexota bacterium]
MTKRLSLPNTHALGFIVCGVILLGLPMLISNYQVNLLGRFLTYAMVAVGLDMLWGYTGMLSLGQGLFFSLGAYCFALYLNLETAGAKLPEFMGLYGVTELPFFWQPFYSPIFAALAAVILPMLIAGGIGFMIFRSRIQGVYFSIITQALTAIFALLLIGQQQVINGTNGITEMRTIFGARLAEPNTKVALYLATVVALGAVYLGCRAVIRSRFGRLLIAVRDDENRVRFMGYNPVLIKTLVFMLSAGIAGLAGILLVPQLGIISPKQLDIAASIGIVIWVAVGGRGHADRRDSGRAAGQYRQEHHQHLLPRYLAVNHGRAVRWRRASIPQRHCRLVHRCAALAPARPPKGRRASSGRANHRC